MNNTFTNQSITMKKLRKLLGLVPLLLLLLLPHAAVSQTLPTTLVVRTTESKELCYDLSKISKITFGSGAIKMECVETGTHFTPAAVTIASIDKLFFANDREENTTHIAPVRSAPMTALSYYNLGREIHIEGFTSSDEILYVYTTDGQLLSQLPITSATCILDVTRWSQGLYIATTNARHTIKITIL